MSWIQINPKSLRGPLSIYSLICDVCGMKLATWSNLPEYGMNECDLCYFKSVHPVREVIKLFKYECEYRKDTMEREFSAFAYHVWRETHLNQNWNDYINYLLH